MLRQSLNVQQTEWKRKCLSRAAVLAMLCPWRCLPTAPKYGMWAKSGGCEQTVVEPIGKAKQHEVVAATEDYVQRASEVFGRRFRPVPVLFDLAGRTAGMFKLVGRRGWIRYNPWIFAKYYAENLKDTVPHEVLTNITTADRRCVTSQRKNG